MRNFIIFFSGKEGTSPLVRLLNNFDQISILHQVNNRGWEPFDAHNCGPMPLRSLKQCLDIVFNNESIDIKQVNNIYTKTSTRPLEEIRKDGVAGFKMRFASPSNPLHIAAFTSWNKLSKRLFQQYNARSFKSMMIELLKKNNTTVFFAVRQDLLRWALSKYHGDGTGKPGHLQFKLASGEISKEEIGKFHVDCRRLGKIILRCEKVDTQKHQLMEEFKLAGIQVYPLCYEDFLKDKHKYFEQIFKFLELEISKKKIDVALEHGAYFKKVHSDDISDFVVNHQEVLKIFNNRFISWH